MKLILALALALATPHQEGPYRRQIGEDGTTVVHFAKPFDAVPKCTATPARVKTRWVSREWVEVIGPIGAGFDVTCWESSR